MKMLALEDLKGFDEDKIIKHLSENYSGDKSGFDYGNITPADIVKAQQQLQEFQILIAYESVGGWGSDSSSYFLLLSKKTNKLYEVHGSHCSCYGFEGQLDLEQTELKTILQRIENNKNVFYCGVYDTNETENQKAVKSFILSMNN